MRETDGGAAEHGERSSTGHGWWPYLGPYFAFLLTVEGTRHVPDGFEPWMLLLKPIVPAALLVYFWRAGSYPELRDFRWDLGAVADVLVGLASAALWMAPYVFFPSFREALGVDPSEGFDRHLLGDDRVMHALALRLVGYAMVTPFFEELFIRSFVMRYADIYPGPGDFRRLPLARFSVRSFIVTVIVFTLGHVPWEWPVAVLWVSLTNLWFYRRGHIGSVVLVHASANASILAAVVALDGVFRSPDGTPLSLWFFV